MLNAAAQLAADNPTREHCAEPGRIIGWRSPFRAWNHAAPIDV